MSSPTGFDGCSTAMPSSASERRVLRVTDSLTIPVGELIVRAVPSGGPGGQHANRSHTRVEIVFDIEASRSLDDDQRQALSRRFGREVVSGASDERSQRRNRDLAMDRLVERLADALHVDAPRRPTRPTKASINRRLADKQRAARRRSERRIGPDA